MGRAYPLHIPALLPYTGSPAGLRSQLVDFTDALIIQEVKNIQ